MKDINTKAKKTTKKTLSKKTQPKTIQVFGVNTEPAIIIEQKTKTAPVTEKKTLNLKSKNNKIKKESLLKEDSFNSSTKSTKKKTSKTAKTSNKQKISSTSKSIKTKSIAKSATIDTSETEISNKNKKTSKSIIIDKATQEASLSLMGIDSKDELIEAQVDSEKFDKTNKSISRDAKIIMKDYFNGKEKMTAAEASLKKILNLQETDKITDLMLNTAKVPTAKKRKFEENKALYFNGKKATLNTKEEMINKLNLFIYYIIEKRFGTFRKMTKDLYQEGVIGILKGIDFYDASISKPTTFFYIYIIHEMTEFINININKTSAHYSTNIVKVKKAINQFAHEGRDWTVKDIAQETGISAETILQAIRIMESANEMHYDTVDYLDSQMTDRMGSPEDEFFKTENTRLIMKAISTLSTDEANVILYKYGLYGGKALSYKDISRKFGIQVDKVKKLKNTALIKLKKSKIIMGNFNLQKEDKILNSNPIGVVDMETANALLDDIDKYDI